MVTAMRPLRIVEISERTTMSISKMSVNTVKQLCMRSKPVLKPRLVRICNVRRIVSKKSGAVLPKPKTESFRLLRIAVAVIPGLFIGAGISKTMANFLEENDLFVPSDDDDEDD